MFHIVVEGTPVPKGRPRFSMCGSYVKTYTPQKTKDFEDLVRLKARLFMNKYSLDMFEKEPLKLTICFYMPIPKSLSEKKRQAMNMTWHTKKPDTDNLVKSVCDSLNSLVWKDDSQVSKIESWKLYSFEPRTEIWVNELEE